MQALQGYYEVYEEAPPQSTVLYEDQRHINRAYTLYRLFMAEMLQVRDADNILDRIRRNMYTTEDTLHEYVAAIPRGMEAKR